MYYTVLCSCCSFFCCFFFNDTATTEIYTLSLHDALPISRAEPPDGAPALDRGRGALAPRDRGEPRGEPRAVSVDGPPRARGPRHRSRDRRDRDGARPAAARRISRRVSRVVRLL